MSAADQDKSIEVKATGGDSHLGGRDIDHNKKRAQGSLDAIKVADGLDPKKVPDGKYSANSIGYTGPVAPTHGQPAANPASRVRQRRRT